jgi:hypothetical protein
LVLVGLKQHQAPILLQVHQVTTLFYPQSPQTVVVVVAVCLVAPQVKGQKLVAQVVAAQVRTHLLVVRVVLQVTPLQLHRHKDQTVERVLLTKQRIVLVLVVVVLQQLVATLVLLLVVRVVLVEQAQPHQ